MCKSGLLAIPQSFYSKALYRRVGASWRGRGFAYLFFVLLLFGAVGTSATTLRMMGMLRGLITDIAPQLPVITIQGGKASAEQTQPVFIKTKDGDTALVAVIDTKSQYTRDQFSKGPARIWMTDTEVLVKNPQGHISSTPIKKTWNILLAPATIEQNFERYHTKIGLMVYGVSFLLAVVIGYLYAVFFGLVLGIIGWVVNFLLGTELSFGAVVNLSVVALTPALLLKTVCHFLPTAVPYILSIYGVVSLGYLLFALIANREPR